MRTLRTRKGLEVKTDMTDEQAADIVAAARNSTFGTDIAAKFKRRMKLSEDQLAWLHKLALDATGKSAQCQMTDTPDAVNLTGIYNLVKRGERGGEGFPLLRIKLPLSLCEGRTLFIGLRNWATSEHQSNVHVRGGSWECGSYYGRIDQLGIFYRTKECDDGVTEYLRALAARPEQMLADAGRDSMTCPCCGQPLISDQQLAHGYGLPCADRYGLPWQHN